MYDMLEIVYFSIYRIIQTCKSPFYWLLVGIIFYQYRRIAGWEERIYGRHRGALIYNLLTSLLTGLMGGILGSTILIYLAVTINLADFYAVFILAILLSLIDPRYMCFAYGGGIISLISLNFGYPRIDVPGMMTVIGVLHLVESILILVDGTKGKLPIIMDRSEGIVGGFTMNRFWPVPFTILVDRGFIYPVTIMAILGYGDIALASYPEKKAKKASGMLFVFSIMLITLARISIQKCGYRYIAAAFAPIAHETIVILGRKMEERGNLIFKPSAKGLKVLDARFNSIGSKMGLKPGDIILSINGYRVYCQEDMYSVLDRRYLSLKMEVFDRARGFMVKEYGGYVGREKDLGLLLLPGMPEYAFQIEKPKGIIERIMDGLNKGQSRFKS